jgi:tRNA(Ile2) C34 agmatinyltransferase TiaS
MKTIQKIAILGMLMGNVPPPPKKEKVYCPKCNDFVPVKTTGRGAYKCPICEAKDEVPGS